MRTALAVVIVVMVAPATAHADDTLPHVRSVLERHATASRRSRTVAAVVFAGAGIGLGVGGMMMVRDADGWFAELERGLGYMVIGIGGIAMVKSVVLVATDTPFERLRDEVDSEHEARFARTTIADKARAARRGRRITGNVGLALLGSGAIAVTAGALVGHESDTGETLLGSGIVFGTLGAGIALGAAFESRWEQLDRDLAAAPSTAMVPALAPTRGGLLAGVGGTF